MEDTLEMSRLSIEDQQAALAIIKQLGDCQSRKDLHKVFKKALIPLLDCNGLFYVRIERDRNDLQLLDDICDPELPRPSWQKFLDFATQSQLLASNFPDEAHNRLNTAFFCCSEPNIHQAYRCCAIVTLFDAQQPTIALYICHLKHQDHCYNMRDFKLLQILHCALMQSIKAILFREECQNYQLMLDHLSNQGEPLALLRDNGTVIYKNKTFKQIVDQDNFRYIAALLNQIYSNPIEKEAPVTLIQLGRRLYEFTPVLIDDKKNEGIRLYLLRFTRAKNKDGQLLRQWSQAGLTHRELQVAALLHQGLSTHIIAEQLFLSYHTVRNHIKHIYEKTGVTRRSELMAWCK